MLTNQPKTTALNWLPLAPTSRRILTAGVASLWIGCPAAAADAPIDVANSDCLDCHDGEESVVTFGDGATLSVGVAPDDWAKTSHAKEIGCSDCHSGMAETPHGNGPWPDKRAWQLDRTNSCRKCHFAYQSRSQDSIHQRQLARGNRKAPTCIDCHAVHEPRDATGRLGITARCARCHDKQAKQYANSAHGKALADGHSDDVPVCTDCHGTHGINDPRKPAFHTTSWNLCANCHGDPERMRPFDLSAVVVQTYLDDFHGRSNARFAQAGGAAADAIATCSDCHGVHEVVSFRRAKADGTLKHKVIVACRKCHKEAPLEFADAWLAHSPPTLQSAPLVWLVKLAYRILIPLILTGLVLHILLHLWRARVHR